MYVISDIESPKINLKKHSTQARDSGGDKSYRNSKK